MSRTIKAIDGISGVPALTVNEVRQEVRQLLRYGNVSRYRNRFDTQAYMAERKVINGLIAVKPRRVVARFRLWPTR